MVKSDIKNGEISVPMQESESLESIEYSIEDVLGKIGVGLYQYRLFVVCGLSFTADSVEVALLSFLSLCAQDEWHLSNAQASSITAVVFAGELVGALFWGQLADRFGRRMMTLVCGSIITFFGLISAWSPNLAVLLVFRFLVGVGVGGFTIPFDLLAEFIPTTHRAKFLMGLALFWSFGTAFVSTMAWALIATQGWRVLVAVCSLPVGVAVLTGYFLPESPRWLLSKHNKNDAKKILNQAALYNGIALPEDYTLVHKDLEVSEDISAWGELLIPEFRRSTLACWVIWFCFGFSYYGLVLLTVKIFAQANTTEGTCSFDYQDIFVSSTSEIVSITFAAYCLIDRVGRKGTQILTYGGCGVLMIVIGIQVMNGGSAADITAVIFFARSCIFIANNATWVMTPELYPTEIRGTGHSASNAFARLGAFIVPYWVGSAFSIMDISALLGFINILACCTVFIIPKETAGHALDDEDRQSESCPKHQARKHTTSEGNISERSDDPMNDGAGKARDQSLQSPTEIKHMLV
mmetsp:Transcript_3229/g.4550  ORF Transcript_3229/g.4550 Transcript_3229/m.4550 type:complete len:522 (-) Transcript_3229:56-1621(-)